MTRIILVRHGQTEWNRVERFRGRADLALDERGVRQAEAMAERLSEWPVAAVYTSPLRRAVTTAGIVAKRLGLEATVDPGLLDMDFGEWEGLSPVEAEARDATMWEKWVRTPHLVTFPGGESLDAVRHRASTAVAGLSARHAGQTVVLVAHRVVCQALILDFLGLETSNFWRIVQDVAAINVFEVTDLGISVLALNDTCHLKGLESPPSRIYRGAGK